MSVKLKAVAGWIVYCLAWLLLWHVIAPTSGWKSLAVVLLVATIGASRPYTGKIW